MGFEVPRLEDNLRGSVARHRIGIGATDGHRILRVMIHATCQEWQVAWIGDRILPPCGQASGAGRSEPDLLRFAVHEGNLLIAWASRYYRGSRILVVELGHLVRHVSAVSGHGRYGQRRGRIETLLVS